MMMMSTLSILIDQGHDGLLFFVFVSRRSQTDDRLLLLLTCCCWNERAAIFLFSYNKALTLIYYDLVYFNWG